MAVKRPKGKLGVDYAWQRDANGNIIGTQPIGGAGKAGAGGSDPLALLRAVIRGNAKAGSLSKIDQKALAKFDIGDIKYKQLAKFGLDDSFTKEQFKDFKGQYKDLGADNRLGKKDVRQLAKFAVGTAEKNEIARLERGVDKIVPDGDDILAPERGNLANLNMSIFARAAVKRARGVKAAIGTSMRGDVNYGKSLARLSLGGMAV